MTTSETRIRGPLYGADIVWLDGRNGSYIECPSWKPRARVSGPVEPGAVENPAAVLRMARRAQIALTSAAGQPVTTTIVIMADPAAVPTWRKLAVETQAGTAKVGFVAGVFGAWTRWRTPTGDCDVWVVLPSLVPKDSLGSLFTDLGEETVARLVAYAHLMGTPLVLTPGHTAHTALRLALAPDPTWKGERPDRRREPFWNTGGQPVMNRPAASSAGDMIWTRPLRKSRGEGRRRWVHAFDMNAARLSALGVVEVAAGKLEHAGPIAFEERLAGWWSISPADVPRGLERHAPPDIQPWDGVGPRGMVVVTTPIMQMWADRGVQPPVSDAWVGEGRRLFYSIAERWRDARAYCQDTRDRAVLDAIKATYRAGAGLLASPGGLIYRPDWYHATMDRQRVTLIGHARRIHSIIDEWPIRVHTDCLYYASDQSAEEFADLVGIRIGPGLGQFSVKTALLSDVLGRLR